MKKKNQKKNNELLPTIQNWEISTRSANPNCLMFTTKKMKNCNIPEISPDEIKESVEHFTKILD